MSDLPTPEINPPGPDVPASPAGPEPAPFPEIAPADVPQEAPSPGPVPDDGRPYD